MLHYLDDFLRNGFNHLKIVDDCRLHYCVFVFRKGLWKCHIMRTPSRLIKLPPYSSLMAQSLFRKLFCKLLRKFCICFALLQFCGRGEYRHSITPRQRPKPALIVNSVVNLVVYLVNLTLDVLIHRLHTTLSEICLLSARRTSKTRSFRSSRQSSSVSAPLTTLSGETVSISP